MTKDLVDSNQHSINITMSGEEKKPQVIYQGSNAGSKQYSNSSKFTKSVLDKSQDGSEKPATKTATHKVSTINSHEQSKIMPK